jgi:hypothetical protein
MGFFGKIGGGFKWLGKNILRLIRRDETLIVAKLAAGVLPIPAFSEIVSLVKMLDSKDLSGIDKMANAIEDILPILEKYDITIEEESDLRFIIELAVKIMKGKARVINNGRGDT